MKEAMSIGIIGGADGPTAVFVTGRFPWEIILLVVVSIALCAYLFRKKK
jgi:Na+-transporting methylmalonyl-CoA/oxaloacetate decarboxylase beta subunit